MYNKKFKKKGKIMKRDYEKLFAPQVFLKRKVLDGIIDRIEKCGEVLVELPDSRVTDIIRKVRDEPRPLRKYCISNSVAGNIYSIMKEETQVESLKWFKTKYFRQICRKYAGEVGFAYIGSTNHFIYSVTDQRIQIVSFNGKGDNIEKDMYFGDISPSIDGVLTIEPFDISDEITNIPELVYSAGISGLWKSGNNLGSDKSILLVKHIISEWKEKFMLVKGNFDETEFLNTYLNEIKYLSLRRKSAGEMMMISPSLSKYGEHFRHAVSLEAWRNFFLTYSALMLVFLKLSEVKVETFESIITAGKNIPTEFINPETGKRNQGVIRVDKLYNTEITIDCPFGVRGHWRNQYCGRDSEGNPIHKMIFIEAFEKKGYHRRATKDIIEQGA